ncbi:hypothetical protein AVDCRST_MAG94-2670 [uncultured Leptolyngbya sp.]|uniref:Calcium-binding protein n=1 Tax=uncultured Leptolyngbya sp. TaxID=332963 RepID=A0A6J4M3I6_9CYAN|nr:hypothetical protein AVDCRST_MAG94-2670 [uncultured Leptolyngbya sp.]
MPSNLDHVRSARKDHLCFKTIKTHLTATFALALATSVTTIAANASAPPASAAGEQAQSADSFVDSIGVNVHLRNTGGVYSKYNDIIKPRLQELGVRHIRDNSGKDAAFYQKLNDLATIGIKSTLIVDVERYQPAEAVALAKAIPNSLVAVEGPNERDHFGGFSYKGLPWPENLRSYQSDLYKAIKRDPATADIAVLHASLATPRNVSAIGFSADSFDQGNIHYYHGVQPAFDLDAKVIPELKKVTGGKPLVVTETGWSNVSQPVKAKYVPRLYLEHFNRGIARTFLYELHNQGTDPNPEHNFGILNFDGSPQPAFTALKNLISLVQDSGGNFTPGKLDYQLSGQTTGVNHTLLQKSDGKFDLILWQDDEGENNPDQQVTLTLNQPFSSAKTFLPLNSTEPTNSYSNPKSLDLRVPDHPLVVELD